MCRACCCLAENPNRPVTTLKTYWIRCENVICHNTPTTECRRHQYQYSPPPPTETIIIVNRATNSRFLFYHMYTHNLSRRLFWPETLHHALAILAISYLQNSIIPILVLSTRHTFLVSVISVAINVKEVCAMATHKISRVCVSK